MIVEQNTPVVYTPTEELRAYNAAPTERIEQPRATKRAFAFAPILAGILFGLVFVATILANYAGMLASVRYGHAVAVVAAFGCAGLIGLAFRPAKGRDTTTERVYYIRLGNRIMQLRGDEAFDKWHGKGK
jgi:hypothetical protein